MKNLMIFKLLIIIILHGFVAELHAQGQDFSRKVEQMPTYPGGEEALEAFLKEHIQYPEEGIAQKVEGIVYVIFIVEKDGSITQVEALEGIGDAFEKEAERVVRLMPKWNPGKEKGEKIRVLFNLPIEFKLSR